MLEFSYLVYQLKAEESLRVLSVLDFPHLGISISNLTWKNHWVFSTLLSSFLPECLLNPYLKHLCS